jgi:hypothetical protein
VRYVVRLERTLAHGANAGVAGISFCWGYAQYTFSRGLPVMSEQSRPDQAARVMRAGTIFMFVHAGTSC